MGLFSFAKNAGRKLIGRDDDKPPDSQPAAEAAPAETAPAVAPAPADAGSIQELPPPPPPVAEAPAVDTSSHGTVVGSGAERTYIAREGQTVEEIAAYFYGDAAHTQSLFDQNPYLEQRGSALPGGLPIRIHEGGPEAAAEQPGEPSGGGPAADAETARQLTEFVQALGLSVENLVVQVSGDVATVTGTTPSQADREKIILAIGNTEGIAQVDDQLAVQQPAPEATFYTVQSGDTLSGIAQQHYGDPAKYPVIFEANRPMLENPDLIYPGQTLRIPPQ